MYALGSRAVHHHIQLLFAARVGSREIAEVGDIPLKPVIRPRRVREYERRGNAAVGGIVYAAIYMRFIGKLQAADFQNHSVFRIFYVCPPDAVALHVDDSRNRRAVDVQHKRRLARARIAVAAELHVAVYGKLAAGNNFVRAKIDGKDVAKRLRSRIAAAVSAGAKLKALRFHDDICRLPRLRPKTSAKSEIVLGSLTDEGFYGAPDFEHRRIVQRGVAENYHRRVLGVAGNDEFSQIGVRSVEFQRNLIAGLVQNIGGIIAQRRGGSAFGAGGIVSPRASGKEFCLSGGFGIEIIIRP